eukprot:7523876-Pyramimonas_sp.AAC.1
MHRTHRDCTTNLATDTAPTCPVTSPSPSHAQKGSNQRSCAARRASSSATLRPAPAPTALPRPNLLRTSAWRGRTSTPCVHMRGQLGDSSEEMHV